MMSGIFMEIDVGGGGAAWALALVVALPLVSLTGLRAPRSPQFLAWLLGAAPLPAMAVAACVLWGGWQPSLTIDPSGLHVGLVLDPLRAWLLGAVAMLWALAGVYAACQLDECAGVRRFGVFWLLTLSGCLGVFLAADLAGFYLLFGLMSLAAFGLVIHDNSAAARRAAGVYLVLALLGEAFLLLGFVLLAGSAPDGSLAIEQAVANFGQSLHPVQTGVFLLLGFGLKLGVVPLHGWLPIAHPAAPTPASAVLSGAIIKTGALGLLLFFLPDGPLGGWGPVLVVLGLVTAYVGVLAGVFQPNPKAVLAYSSVSQMGVLAVIVGGTLLAGGRAAAAAAVVVLYAIHHVFVKGALFLGVGVLAGLPTRRRRPVLVVCGLLGLSFAGLPLTGGMIAKMAMKPLFDDGFMNLLLAAASAGSALLMIHLIARLRAVPEAATPKNGRGVSRGMLWAWAGCAMLGFTSPWVLGAGMLPPGFLSVGVLWDAGWPVLVGGGFAAAWLRCLSATGSMRGERAPLIPPGDCLAILTDKTAALSPRMRAWSGHVQTAIERWPVAGVALALLPLILAALLLLRR